MLELIQAAISADKKSGEKKQRIENIQNRIEQLTPREHEVMMFVLDSRQNKIIAHELGISIKTVELHRANLMTKMSANSSTELVRMAMMAGADVVI